MQATCRSTLEHEMQKRDFFFVWAAELSQDTPVGGNQSNSTKFRSEIAAHPDLAAERDPPGIEAKLSLTIVPPATAPWHSRGLWDVKSPLFPSQIHPSHRHVYDPSPRQSHRSYRRDCLPVDCVWTITASIIMEAFLPVWLAETEQPDKCFLPSIRNEVRLIIRSRSKVTAFKWQQAWSPISLLLAESRERKM